MTNGEAHPETRRMMETAIRRLNVLEYVILGFAMVLALFAGALTAWMVENLTGAPFRLSWALSSLLFFVVPGWVVFRRERQAEGARVGGTDSVGSEDITQLENITEVRDDGGR